MRSAIEAWLNRLWWRPRPNVFARALQPLAWLVQQLARWDRWRQLAQVAHLGLAPSVPVVVVGNLIVGGAGKTPTVMALVQGMRERGWTPGVISRGYGRHSETIELVTPHASAMDTGDEPLLIHLRTQAPVCVGRDRVATVRQLCQTHPHVDLIISDDGLQHWRLPRQAQVLVFDGRGVGNGLTLPAGPLRQAFEPEPPTGSFVLYNAPRPSTPWPGTVAQRRLAGAVALTDWWRGVPAQQQCLRDLAQRSQSRPLLAAAGMAEPERFFSMLEGEGLRIERLPLPDHSDWSPLPWPADTKDVVLTEKDAVKLRPEAVNGVRVWVVALDFHIPTEFIDALDAQLRVRASTGTAP